MVTIELLRKIPVFQGLDDGPLLGMSHICKIRDYGPGDVIFREGDPATIICYLVSGEVDICVSKDPGKCVSKIHPGECFGWSALVSPNIFTASAVAKNKSAVLIIDGAGLEAYMRSDAGLCFSVFENLARTISERLAVTRRQLLDAHKR